METLLWRALALPYRAQLQLHELLAGRLREAGRAPTKHDDLIERQRATLAAMRDVAEALDLPEGQAPAAAEFSDECKRLGLKMNASAAGRAFNGWRNATIAFEGGRVPESARLIRQRRALRRGPYRDPADCLAHVAEWLESEEHEENTKADYMQWRNRYNERVAGTGAPLAPHWDHFARKVFPELTVEDIVAAARGEVEDWRALLRQRAEERLQHEENPLRLVTVATAAALLGTSQFVLSEGLRQGSPGLPVVVATLSKERVLIADDVLAYRVGETPPPREPGEFDGSLLNAAGLAVALGRKRHSVKEALARRAWHLLPRPTGRTRTQYYWLRSDVEAWSSHKAGPSPERRAAPDKQR